MNNAMFQMMSRANMFGSPVEFVRIYKVNLIIVV